MSNFSHVVIPSDGNDVRILVRLPDRYRSAELSVIPHGQNWMFEAPILPQGSSRNTQGSEECYCHGTSNVETPSHAIITSLKVMKQKLLPWDGHTQLIKPLQGQFYPVDKNTLPPGVDPSRLVTVAQYLNGDVVGGVTYQILN